jgi:glyoxylase I family protein
MPLELEGMVPLLQVYDMPTSIRFYCGQLGFELVNKSQTGNDFGWALLQLNGVELMLNTRYENDHRPPAPDPQRVAAHDDVCLYFGCRDVDAAYRYLTAQGFDVKKPVIRPYGMKQLTIVDPDGYPLCFQWPA